MSKLTTFIAIVVIIVVGYLAYIVWWKNTGDIVPIYISNQAPSVLNGTREYVDQILNYSVTLPDDWNTVPIKCGEVSPPCIKAGLQIEKDSNKIIIDPLGAIGANECIDCRIETLTFLNRNWSRSFSQDYYRYQAQEDVGLKTESVLPSGVTTYFKFHLYLNPHLTAGDKTEIVKIFDMVVNTLKLPKKN